jgi:hypothetical protein
MKRSGRSPAATDPVARLMVDVPLRPASTLETLWRSRRFPLDDYAFSA